VTGQWEQYVDAVELHPSGECVQGNCRKRDIAAPLAPLVHDMIQAAVVTVAPLIAEDTRVRMVEAAVTIMEREGFDGGRAKIAEEIAQAIEAQAGNGEWAGDYYAKSAQIAREIGARNPS
jgi:hypothetical protein